jgi:hypothetical protein
MMGKQNLSEEVRILTGAGVAGVYTLLLAGEVVYAGRSENVFARIAAHQQEMSRRQRGLRRGYTRGPTLDPGYIFDEVRFRLMSKERLEAEEIATIQEYRPARNVKYNRPPPPNVNVALPIFQGMIAKAKERRLATEIKRRKLPPSVRAVEADFQRYRDQRMKITLPKVSLQHAR